MRGQINEEYFNWLYDLVCDRRYSRSHSYRKLLTRLHNTRFTYLIPRDQNRADDGKNLRYRYAIHNGYEDMVDYVLDDLSGPCSVLEMMVALSIRCEENIMDDPSVGDRTGQWFWNMIVNLGLGSMLDNNYDEDLVDDILERFLKRKYEPDGRGGLFTIRGCTRDLRRVEIWYQLCWYLDTIA